MVAAHQREVVSLLVLRHQLHHLPSNARAQAQAQVTMAVVGGVEVALQRRDDRRHRVEQADEVDHDATGHSQQAAAAIMQQVGQMSHSSCPSAETEQVELDPLESCLRIRLAPLPQLPGNSLQGLVDPGLGPPAPTPGEEGIDMILLARQGAHAFDIALEEHRGPVSAGPLRRVQRIQQGHVAQGIGITASFTPRCIHRHHIVQVVTGAIEEHTKTQSDWRDVCGATAVQVHRGASCLYKKHKQAPTRRCGTSANGQPYAGHFRTCMAPARINFPTAIGRHPPGWIKVSPLARAAASSRLRPHTRNRHRWNTVKR